MTLAALIAQITAGMVTLGGWFGDINPILTGLGTLVGMAYYVTLLVERWRGSDGPR